MSTLISSKPKRKAAQAAPVKFARHVSLPELRTICRSRKWTLEDSGYENGGDHVKVFFSLLDVDGHFMFSTFNGRFFGHARLTQENRVVMFNEESTQLDADPWYRELLNLLYVP